MTWVSGPSGGGEILRNLQEVRLELPAVGAEATGEDENQPILNWWCCVKGVGAKVLVVERMDWKSRMGLWGLMMQGSDMLIRGALHKVSVSRCRLHVTILSTPVPGIFGCSMRNR